MQYVANTKQDHLYLQYMFKNSADFENANPRNPEISKILDECKDFFPDYLPKGLPPERAGGDFKIELKDDSKPVEKGLYRMSQAELEETKAQVDKLLEMGFLDQLSARGQPLCCLPVKKMVDFGFTLIVEL